MITLLVLAAILFVLAFLFGKRFGLLTLALGAGYIISGYESSAIIAASAPYLNQYVAYVPAAIVVLPAIFLALFTKGRHRKLIPRFITSVLFAAAGVVFVIASPSTPASLTGSFPYISQNIGLFVTGALLLAILENAFGKASKKKSVEEPKK